MIVFIPRAEPEIYPPRNDNVFFRNLPEDAFMLDLNIIGFDDNVEPLVRTQSSML